MKLYALLLLIPLTCNAEFLCGLNRVEVLANGLVVNGTAYRYRTTTLGRNGDYFYEFQDNHQLRMTQHNRLTYRDLKTPWASCKPVIYYQENGTNAP